MKKLIILPVFFVSLILYSCGGGGSSNGYNISIGSGSVEVDVVNSTDNRTISESDPPSIITIGFNVHTNAPQYSAEFYLSRDNVLSNDDYEFYQTDISRSRGVVNVVLDNESWGYNNLMNYYGGKYYVIVRVSTDSSSSWAASSYPIVLKKIWTFAVYMDADNSLTGIDNYNIQQMESVGSNEDVNVVVEDDNEITTAKRYFIKQGEIVELSNLSELDMAKVTTLENFGKWIKNSFPADHYFIVIWDHGLGFESIYPSETNRDLLLDETNGNDIMSVPDFAFALDNISKTLGKKIDIVGIDACLMNMIEVAYEIKNSADILISSEGIEPADGWPYSSILYYLINNPYSSLSLIAAKVVEYYTNYYDGSYSTTQSAIDLSRIDNLTLSVNNLSESILNNWNNSSVTSALEGNIFNSVQRFNVSSTDNSYADLGSLAKLIYVSDNMTPGIKISALKVIDNLSKAVIVNGYNGYDNGSVNGLTIWFPNTTIFNEQIEHYEQLEFAKDTLWDELLDNMSK